MNYKQIVSEVQKRLPLYTDLTTENKTASISVVSNTATINFIQPHNLSVGNQFSFRADIPVSIIGFVENPGYIEFETQFDHDITIGFNSTVAVSGFTNTNLNQSWPVFNITARNKFSIKTTELVGSLNGNESMGYESISQLGGLYDVELVPSTTSITTTINIHDLEIDSTSIRSNPSVQFALNDTDAEDAYTKQSDRLVNVYVIPDESQVSKDSRVTTDGVSVLTTGVEFRQVLLDSLHILVFFRLENGYRNILDAVNDSRNSLLYSIAKSMLGMKPQSGLTEQYSDRIKLVGHGDAGVSGGNKFYVHRYDFEHISMISECDTQDDISSINASDLQLDTRYNHRNLQTNIDLSDE